VILGVKISKKKGCRTELEDAIPRGVWNRARRPNSKGGW